jgi:two-component system, chemotaxis family, CheB/CheR fusion protein
MAIQRSDHNRMQGAARLGIGLPGTRPAVVRYGFAVAVVGLSTLIAVHFRPFSETTPFLFFYPAVFLAVWFGRLGPGLLATGLCSLSANYFLLAPLDQFSYDKGALIRTSLFFLGFAGICLLAEVARGRLQSIIQIQSTLLNLALDPIIVRDAEDRIIYWNQGAERLYGWTSEEACGQVTHVLLNTVFPGSREEVTAEFKKAGRWHGELTHTRKDGGTVVVASSWTLQESAGKQFAVLEANYDLSARKKAEQALSLSQTTLKTIYNSVYDGIVVHSASGDMLEVNDRFLALYRITREDVARLKIADISSAKSPIDTLPSLWARVLAGESQLFEWKARRPHDDSEFDVEVFLHAIRLQDGTEAVLANVRDITDRKRAEKALVCSEKLAASGRLAATIAHEINNPLEAMTNLVYLLGPKVSDPSAQDYVHMLQTQLQTVSRIATQTLKFHRENGVPVAFDLSELTAELIDFYGASAKQHGVEIRRRMVDGAKVVGFSGEIRQVVSNLLINAIEATPKGGTVEVHLYESVDWRNLRRRGYRLGVVDTGVGIEPEHRSRIFEPFFTTKGEKGTGLGLWVSMGIINRAQGSMRVRSTAGLGHSGTCFSVFLPAEIAVGEHRGRRRYEAHGKAAG